MPNSEPASQAPVFVQATLMSLHIDVVIRHDDRGHLRTYRSNCCSFLAFGSGQHSTISTA